MESSLTSCRICLVDGATFPIFGDNDDTSILSKLLICLSEKIEDVVGYPRNICELCNETLNTLHKFIINFRESTKILERGLVTVKHEKIEYLSDFGYDESHEHVEKHIKSETKVEIDIETETLLKLKPLHTTQTKLKECNSSLNKSSLRKGKPKTKRKMVIRNENSKIKASIIEGDFRWTGHKWCVKTKSRSTKTEPKLQAQKKIKREEKIIKNPKENTTRILKLCDYCGKVFKSDRLKAHINTNHISKSLKCTICNKTSTSEYYLRKHINRVHSKKKNFMCAQCGQVFALCGDLTHHKRQVHEKHLRPKKSFKCSYCDKTYKCTKSVIIHERSLHLGIRPAVCDVCGSSFYHEDYLKQHMRLHTGETPFKCPICGRGYAQRANMKSHMRHNHRLKDLDPAMLNKLKPNHLKHLKV